jgi:hypothetical protein
MTSSRRTIVPLAFVAAAATLVAVAPQASRAQTFASPTSPATTPATQVAATMDPVEARAREWLGRLQQQPPAIDRSQLTVALSQTYDDVTVAAMARQVAGFGAPKRFAAGRVFALPDGSTAHVYRVTWDTGSLDFLFGLDANGKISAMYFRAA